MIKKALYILIFCIVGAPVALSQQAVFTTYPTQTQNHNKWIVRDVNPGSVYQELITVKNLTDLPIDLQVKTVEFTDQKGKITLLENQPSQNIGNWIKTENDQVSLQPKEKKDLKLEIEVPSDAAIGKYQAAVLVSHQTKNTSEINLSTRIGNRVYLNVTHSKLLQTNTYNLPVGVVQILLITIASIGIFYGLKPLKPIKQNENHDC